MSVFRCCSDVSGSLGTFSKTSKLIRPRKPFAKDTCLFDYDYDSEDEWDEEEAGDGEDVNSDDARSQGSDEADSQDELDDWMCEDNEIEYEEGFEADGSEIQKDPTIAARDRAIAKKERSAKDSLARSKAPKALVPVSRGPVWEPQYGHQLHSAFESMSICFLNGEVSLAFALRDITLTAVSRRCPTWSRSVHFRDQACFCQPTCTQANSEPDGLGKLNNARSEQTNRGCASQVLAQEAVPQGALLYLHRCHPEICGFDQNRACAGTQQKAQQWCDEGGD